MQSLNTADNYVRKLQQYNNELLIYQEKLNEYFQYLCQNSLNQIDINSFIPKNLFYVSDSKIYDGSKTLITPDSISNWFSKNGIVFYNTIDYNKLYRLLSDALVYFMEHLCICGYAFQTYMIQQLYRLRDSQQYYQLLLIKNLFDLKSSFTYTNGIYCLKYLHCVVPLTNIDFNDFANIYNLFPMSKKLQHLIIDSVRKYFKKTFIPHLMLPAFFDNNYIATQFSTAVRYDDGLKLFKYPSNTIYSHLLPVNFSYKKHSYSDSMLEHLKILLGENENNLNALSELVATSYMPKNKLKKMTIITGSKKSIEIIKKFFKEILYAPDYTFNPILELSSKELFNYKSSKHLLSHANIPGYPVSKNIILVADFNISKDTAIFYDDSFTTKNRLANDFINYIHKIIKSKKITFNDSLYGKLSYHNYIPIVVFTTSTETANRLNKTFSSNLITLQDTTITEINNTISYKTSALISDLALYGLKLLSAPSSNKQSSDASQNKVNEDIIQNEFISKYCKQLSKSYIKKTSIKEYYNKYFACNNLLPQAKKTSIYDKLSINGFEEGRIRLAGEKQMRAYINLNFDIDKFNADIEKATENRETHQETDFNEMINKLLNIYKEVEIINPQGFKDPRTLTLSDRYAQMFKY